METIRLDGNHPPVSLAHRTSLHSSQQSIQHTFGVQLIFGTGRQHNSKMCVPCYSLSYSECGRWFGEFIWFATFFPLLLDFLWLYLLLCVFTLENASRRNAPCTAGSIEMTWCVSPPSYCQQMQPYWWNRSNILQSHLQLLTLHTQGGLQVLRRLPDGQRLQMCIQTSLLKHWIHTSWPLTFRVELKWRCIIAK